MGVLVLVVGAVFALKGKTPEVEVASAQNTGGTRSVLLNASGYVTPRRRATVAAKVTGRVTQMLAEEGMRVHEGQLLATLDDSDARTRLASAIADRDATTASLADLRVNLIDAERELRRTRDLQSGGVFSQQALDAATTRVESLKARIAQTEVQVKAAEARVAMAQQDVENCTIHAPFAGIVVSKDAQKGEMVSPVSAGGGFTRTGIATIVDMNSLEVEVDVNESYIARVKTGMPVTAVLDAYPDWQIPAKVRTVIPTADRQKATVKVRITFDKLDPRILPDMGVKVTFLGDEEPTSQATIVTVPKNAVRQENGSPIVWLYKDDKVERRAVKVGGVRGSDQEVLAGVNAGDQVVIAGFENLKDGAKAQLKR
ncbi:MAG TPA: efflux RND transporter periplasmic adaptor subunit [Terriglobales bacterium]|nr:efflux RND transporter periplasmic adaptor subunit [Terriglobales bacterium]